jgi:RNA polymerase sigma-70 factor (ECF subfamily)
MARMSDTDFVASLEKHRHEFFRYALRNVWNPSVAEDVVAGAVATAYEKLDNFDDGSNFRAWMYRILTNKCYVANRETKRHAIDLDTIDESAFATEEQSLRTAWEDPEWFFEQCGDELTDALQQLSTAERSCLLLLAVGKYSYKEIAGILEIPVGTVMTHLSRGRTKLRRLLLEYARNEGFLSETRASELREKRAAKRKAEA